LEDWQTLKKPKIKFEISFPTYLKPVYIESHDEGYGRIQNYIVPCSEDKYNLKKNEYFLEFFTEKSDSFDYGKFKKDCIDTPRKFPGFLHAYIGTPVLEGDASSTHVIEIWKNNTTYHIQIDASQLAPDIVDKIFASIKIG
jgi:hypothetical protein